MVQIGRNLAGSIDLIWQLGKVSRGNYGLDARQRLRLLNVDRFDRCVGVRTAQDLAVQHAGRLHIGQAIDDGFDLAAARVDIVPDAIGLAGLAVDPFSLLRQLALTVVVHRQQGRPLRQVVL